MKKILLICLLLVLNKSSDAQGTYLRTAMPFLRITPDAHSSSMGETGAATSPDLNSLYWNNAKLAFLDGDYGFSASYVPWLSQIKSGISNLYFTGFRKLDSKQGIAMSVNYFTLGKVNFYDEVGNDIGRYNPNEFSIELAYSRQLSPSMSLGLTGKYLHSDLSNGQNSSDGALMATSGYAFDLGWYYEKTTNNSNILSYGIILSNIGPKIKQNTGQKGQYLPMNLRIGTQLHFQGVANSVNISFDINKLLVPTPPVYRKDSAGNSTGVILKGEDPDKSIPRAILGSFSDAPGGMREQIRQFTAGIGLEYDFAERFFLRAGYHYEDLRIGDMRYGTTGFGYAGNSLRLDLSYIIPSGIYSAYKNTFRITIGFNITQ